jgi:hypothetical protein
VVEIVIPLCVETVAPGLARLNDAHVIEVALGDYINATFEFRGPLVDRGCKFLEQGCAEWSTMA